MSDERFATYRTDHHLHTVPAETGIVLGTNPDGSGRVVPVQEILDAARAARETESMPDLHARVIQAAQARFTAFSEVRVVVLSGAPRSWTAKVIGHDADLDSVVIDPTTGEASAWGHPVVFADGDDARPALEAPGADRKPACF